MRGSAPDPAESTVVFSGSLVRRASVARIALRGELDVAGAPLVDELVARAHGAHHVVIDCSELRFVDAVGIAALIRAVSTGAKVVAVRGPVERTLRVVGVHELICPDSDDRAGGRQPVGVERTSL